jgi:Lon protease-like protein
MADELIEIPLFPLGLVLFPGMALPLHIFESRYRHMIGDCLADRAPFGVALALAGGTHEHEHDLPAPVGTLARIADYERLPDGRFNLLALGTSRFHIAELRHVRPYATALVHPVHDTDEAPGNLAAPLERAKETLSTYLQLVLSLVDDEPRQIEIPNDADEVSYLIGTCLTCDYDEKQRLLELCSTSERLRVGSALLRCELERLSRQVPATARHLYLDERFGLN